MNSNPMPNANSRIPKLRTAFWRKPWTSLDSYLFSEINQPFFMSMLVYNGIFFIRAIGDVTEISGGKFELPFNLFILLFLSEVPEILNLTITMSFLLAALIAIGRLSMDSEILAPQSVGVGFWRLSRPILVYGFILTLVNLYLANYAGPRINEIKIAKSRHFFDNIALPKIQPGVINPLSKGSIMYVDSIVENRLANLLLINEGKESEEILLARHASLQSDRKLGLENCINVRLEKGKGLEVITGSYLNRPIPTSESLSVDQIKAGPRDILNTWDLYQLAMSSEAKTKQHYLLAICDRVFPPFACLVFALFAIPLAAKHSRMKRSSGFALSLGLMAVYFLLGKLGKDAVLAGKFPLLLGMTIPNLVFLVFGILLQIGKNRWWSQHFHPITDRLGRFFDFLGKLARKPFQRPTKSKQPSMIRSIGQGRQRHANGYQFPRKLDLYVLRYFASTYLLVQASILIMFLLIEYTDLSRVIQRNQIEMNVFIRYLGYKLPEMIDMTMFFCLLITTLIVFAVMSKNQEVTAVRAGGGSLQRLCLPLLLVGVLCSGASYYMENSLLPNTNRIAVSLRNQIKKRGDTLFSRDVWIKTHPGEILNYRFYQQHEQRLVGVRIFRFGKQEDRLIERIEIPSLVNSNGWRVEKAGTLWRIKPGPDETKPIQVQKETLEADQLFPVGLAQADLSQKKRKPNEFSIAQLREYLHYIKSLGISDTHFLTELQAKYAQPTLPFLMMLLAMPLGFQFGRRGTFYGIGIGLGLGLAFWGLFELTKQMGASGNLHPVVASWSSILLFGFLAIHRFIHLE